MHLLMDFYHENLVERYFLMSIEMILVEFFSFVQGFIYCDKILLFDLSSDFIANFQFFAS